jgi:riboflavin kinase / FMN adenylyltransferase
MPEDRPQGQRGQEREVIAAIEAGLMRNAAEMLGKPYSISGPVQHGDKRGRTIGFPTANVAPPAGVALPPHGVYACRVDGMPAAVSIGTRPTFLDAGQTLIEAYVLDFSGDLYGKVIEIEFVEHLRPELRFHHVEELIEAMERDVERTRAIVAGA